MTRLGEYFKNRSINKASVARRTGLATNRLSQLSINHKAELKASELYLIAIAIGVDPCELLEYVCGDLKSQVKQSD